MARSWRAGSRTNRVYERRFAAPYPARSTVGAQLADGLLVEIEAVALLP